MLPQLHSCICATKCRSHRWSLPPLNMPVLCISWQHGRSPHHSQARGQGLQPKGTEGLVTCGSTVGGSEIRAIGSLLTDWRVSLWLLLLPSKGRSGSWLSAIGSGTLYTEGDVLRDRCSSYDMANLLHVWLKQLDETRASRPRVRSTFAIVTTTIGSNMSLPISMKVHGAYFLRHLLRLIPLLMYTMVRLIYAEG